MHTLFLVLPLRFRTRIFALLVFRARTFELPVSFYAFAFIYIQQREEPRQDRQNRTGITGQEEQYRQNRTGRTVSQNRTGRKRMPGRDYEDKTSRTGLPGQGCQERTGRTGLLGEGCQDGTARIRQEPEQERKQSIARK